MKKDHPVRASITDHPPLVLSQRPISEPERRFLVRYNRIRLLELAGFWCRILFFLLLFLGLHGVILHWFLETRDARILLWLSVVALASVAAIFRWGPTLLPALHLPWWLPIDRNTQILRLRGTLAPRNQAPMAIRSLWTIGNADLELPAHWAAPVRTHDLHENGREVELHAALLPGDRDKPSDRYRHEAHARYFAVACGRLSLAEEQAAAIPGLQAHGLWFSLGLWLILLAGLSGIGGHVRHEQQQATCLALQGQLALAEAEADTLRQRLGSARGLESTALRARGFAPLEPRTLAGIEVLSSPPIDYVAVSRSQDDPVLLLRPREYALLLRAVQVFPPELPDEGSPGSEALREYRHRVARAITTADQPRDLRERMLARLEQLPDLLLEQQMRSYANRARIHPEFLAHLLPRPMVILYRDDPAALPANGPAAEEPLIHCASRSPLCAYDSAQPQVRSLRDPVFTRGEEHILMVPAERFATLERKGREIRALRQQLREVRARPWPAILFALTGITALLALSIIRSFLRARRQVNHFYRWNPAP